ncbi:MAG: hypothetical protein WCQ75_02155 [Bacilli bacterium]
MKKLILFLVLIFTLTGCGVGLPSTSSSFTSSSTSSSSSSSSSSSTTSSSSTSSSVVENLVISSKDSLEQVYGEYNRMTFSLNNNSSSVEWYVDGVQSKSFTGNKFEFVPTEVKTYVIFAKIGSNVSNELEVSVKYPNLSVAQVKSIDENTLEIYADGGINFNVDGNEISSSSYYSLSVSKYVIYFKNKLIQGNSYIIHGEKEYYQDLDYVFTYDTRKLDLKSFKVNGSNTTISSGAYNVTKPYYDTSTNYAITISHLNLEGENLLFSVKRTSPSGELYRDGKYIDMQKGSTYTYTFSVTNDMEAGLYKHEVELNGKVLTFNVNIKNPSSYIYLSSSSATVTRPEPSYSSYRTMSFRFSADYFDYDGITNNYYALSIVGPTQSSSSSIISSIYCGDSCDNTIQTAAFTGYFENSFSQIIVSQKIAANTPLGKYTFTIKAGRPGSEITKTFVLTVIGAKSELKLSADFTNFKSVQDGVTRTVSKTTTSNTYTFEKPANVGTIYSFNWFVKVYNLESSVATQEEIAADANKVYTDKDLFINYADTEESPSGDSTGYIDTNTASIGGGTPNIGVYYKKVVGSLSYTSPDGSITVNNKKFDIKYAANIDNDIVYSGIFEVHSLTLVGTHKYVVTIGDISFTFYFVVKNPEGKINVFDYENATSYNTSTLADVIKVGEYISDDRFTSYSSISTKDGVATSAIQGLDIFSDVVVSDLPFGEYDYEATTKYNGAIAKSYQARVSVVGVDTNQKAIFDPANTIFYGRWRIDERDLKVGQYEFTYKIGSITKTFIINVTEGLTPSLKISSLQIGGNGTLYINGAYHSLNNVSGDIMIFFESIAINEGDYLVITLDNGYETDKIDIYGLDSIRIDNLAIDALNQDLDNTLYTYTLKLYDSSGKQIGITSGIKLTISYDKSWDELFPEVG